MSLNKGDSPPPPYSTYSPPPRKPSASNDHTILGQLSTTRTHHIHSVVENDILPIIHQRTAYGIAQTTIALLPSDIPLPALDEKPDSRFLATDSKDDDSNSIQVIGFASDTEPNVVRLTGQMNRTEFWKSPAVIHELEVMLSESLNPSPTSTDSSMEDAKERGGGGGGVGNESVESSSRPSRRKLLARVMPSMGPEQRSPSNNPEVGVRQVRTAGTVAIKARLEEICLRTLSDFGLYDTMSKQCVVVQVDAQC
ncbi:hypothetical protein yc1106_02514 [Curvularia clavata]|uniref:Uncharacterized protein n=1 Tax=Curvularia clavata TaxID=95742 RepID=A0A9Q8Z3Y0_CURCL|nr:hypothetical protein yc1106_02514 [Curvularia clavata]